jgi:hypothetical protein
LALIAMAMARRSKMTVAPTAAMKAE